MNDGKPFHVELTLKQRKKIGRLFPRFFTDCSKLKYIKCTDGNYEIVRK